METGLGWTVACVEDETHGLLGGWDVKGYVFFASIDGVLYSTFFLGECKVYFPTPESKASFLMNFLRGDKTWILHVICIKSYNR